MSKYEFISAVAKQAAVNQAVAETVIDATVRHIQDSMKAGSELAIAGLGTFINVAVPERQGRNPMTGAAITIKATHKVKFKPAKPLRDAVAA